MSTTAANPPPPAAANNDATKEKDWYSFFHYYVGTDKQWAALLVLLSAILFLGCFIIFFVAALTSGTAEQFYNYLALMGGSLLLLIAACLYVYLSYPENFEKQMKVVKNEPRPNMFFIAAFLLLVASLSLLVYPVYACLNNEMDPMVAVIYFALVIVAILGMAFFCYASHSEQLKQQDGRGSNLVWWLILEVFKMMAPCCTCRCECCCCKGQDCDEEWFKFWEGLIGSDFVIGFLLVFAIALATFAAGLVSVAGDYSNLIEYVYVGAGATFIAGSFIMLYTTFPEQHKSAIGWNLLCKMFCCAKEDHTKGKTDPPPPLSTS